MLGVVTLCGSTKHKNLFYEVAKALTLQDWIVLMPHVFAHSGDSISDEEKEMLDKLHKQKIDMSDGIFVICPDGYIGESTQSEIDYAISQHKAVFFGKEGGMK